MWIFIVVMGLWVAEYNEWIELPEGFFDDIAVVLTIVLLLVAVLFIGGLWWVGRED